MTVPRAATTRTPFFLERDGRRLFVIHFRAVRAPAMRDAVVFFSPFAEEMNRCRRMSTELAEALGAAGIDLVVFDYHGTGDSGGDFADARWDGWAADGAAVVAWATEQVARPVSVLGLRLGAALALSVAAMQPDRVRRAILWQPVLTGATFLTQFLRLRVASALMGGTDKETTQSLRARLAAGEVLEIAGYAIDPALAGAIDRITASAVQPAASLPVDWLELAGEGAQLSPASRRVIDGWRTAGVRLRETVTTGELFWTTQEITVAPALIDVTVARLAEPPP